MWLWERNRLRDEGGYEKYEAWEKMWLLYVCMYHSLSEYHPINILENSVFRITDGDKAR